MENELQMQTNKISGLSLFFVYLLIFTYAAGEYIFTVRVLGVQWYAYRVLVLLLIIFGVNAKINSKFEKYFLYFGITLFLYGLVLLPWASDFVVGVKSSLNVAFGIMLTYILLGLLDTKKNSHQDLIKNITRAWLIAVCFTFIYLGKEYISGETLLYSRARQVFGATESHHLYTSTFGGPSGFGSFLVIGIPLFLHMVFTSKNIIEKFIFYVAVLLTCGAIIMTGSRTSAVTMIVFLILGNAIYFRHKYFIVLMLVFGLVGSTFISYKINPYAFEKHFEKTKYEIENKDKPSSMKVRIAEIPNGIAVLISTNGLGCGPENYYKYKVEHADILPYPEQTWAGSHSVLLSILTEYGIIIFTAFMFWYFYVITKLIAINRTLVRFKKFNESYIAKVLILSQIGFLIWSFAFGGGLQFPLIWLYFATITILASSLSIYTDKLKSQINNYLIQN